MAGELQGSACGRVRLGLSSLKWKPLAKWRWHTQALQKREQHEEGHSPWDGKYSVDPSGSFPERITQVPPQPNGIRITGRRDPDIIVVLKFFK